MIKNAGSAWNLHPSVADPEYLDPNFPIPDRREGQKIAGSATLLSSNYIFYHWYSSTMFDHRAVRQGHTTEMTELVQLSAYRGTRIGAMLLLVLFLYGLAILLLTNF